MQIQNLIITSILFLVSTTTYADAISDIQNDIFKCRTYHNTSIVAGNTDVAVADKYCQTVMNPVTFCAEQKLVKTMAQGGLSNDQILQLRPKYKLECASGGAAGLATAPTSDLSAQATQAQAAEQAQIAQQQAALAAQAAAKQNQQNAASAQQDKQQGLQQTAGLISALAPVVDKVEKAYDKAAEKTTEKAAEGTKTAEAAKTTAPTAATETPPTAPPTPPPAPSAPPAEATLSAGGKTYTEDDLSKMTTEQKTEVFAQHDKDMAAKAGEASAARDAAKGEVPGVAGPADGAAAAAEMGGNVSAPPSEMTIASEKANAELKTQLTSAATTSGTKLVTGLPQTMFTLTQTALTSGVNPILAAYEGVKKTCLGLAEKTEFLCVEGTSPGAVATKTLMSAAGPILAAVNSAQKACSNTSKITGLAGAVLTVAKGVCMASQMACTASCTAALAKLNTSIVTYSSEVNTAATTDNGKASLACASLLTGIAACKLEAQAKMAAVTPILAQIKTIAQKEAAPTPGTSAGLAANCNLKIADALAMGLNIASLVMAKNSADECDKKLAAAGAAGAGVSPTTYCETPANSSTQFCKCKLNSQQAGCPGFNAATATTDKEKEAALKGLDMKLGGKGLSGFASGGGGSGPDASTSALDGINNSASSDSSSAKLSLSDSGAAVTAGGAGAAVNAPGSSGGKGGASDSAEKVDAEKKKWSFGAFAATLGGMFGGGGKAAKTNGNANSKLDNALERKIASDKLAGEITSASGKSNWEKVRQVYLIKENTLLSGQ